MSAQSTASSPEAEQFARVVCYFDLTSLRDDKNDDLSALDAATGSLPALPAAICTWPEHIDALQSHPFLASVPNRAVVLNFPHGNLALPAIAHLIDAIRSDTRIQEVDYVFDWRAWQTGDRAAALGGLANAAQRLSGKRIKVIMETGAYPDLDDLVTAATQVLKLVRPAFLKTSTGKYATGATPEAVTAFGRAMDKAGITTGIKVSGGVRSTETALGYMAQVSRILGKPDLTLSDFRIGTSGFSSSY